MHWRMPLLALSFAGAAMGTLQCGGSGNAPPTTATAGKPQTSLPVAKTAVKGELAPAPATPPPTATAIVIPVREQELRQGFAARQYFISCYHDDLRRNRNAQGRISLRFDIMPEGDLQKLEVAEQTGALSKEFVDCLLTAVGKVTLKPRPGSEPVRLTYPFSFSSDWTQQP
ncbi:MAG: AgmX/PglI C-terminal domain-containing protein [Polyangiaceae bacterium]